jgi:hypothetical protein
MSKKIRPPREIKHAVYEISPMTSHEEIPEEPPEEPPYIDIRQEVAMDSLLSAIVARNQAVNAYTPHVVNMTMYVNTSVYEEVEEVDGVEELEELEEAVSETPIIGLSTMLTPRDLYKPAPVDTDSGFSMKRASEDIMANMLRDIYPSVVVETARPEPVSMIRSYDMDVDKLMSTFDVLHPAPMNYAVKDMVPTIRLSNVANIAAFFNRLKRDCEADEAEDTRRIDMMKYPEIHRVVSNMIYRLVTAIPEDVSRDWLYAIRPMDSENIREWFDRIRSDIRAVMDTPQIMGIDTNTRMSEWFDYINQMDVFEADMTPTLFQLEHAIQHLHMITTLNQPPSEKPEPTANTNPFFAPTSTVPMISELYQISPDMPSIYVSPPNNMVERMGVVPFREFDSNYHFDQVVVTPFAMYMYPTATNWALIEADYQSELIHVNQLYNTEMAIHNGAVIDTEFVIPIDAVVAVEPKSVQKPVPIKVNKPIYNKNQPHDNKIQEQREIEPEIKETPTIILSLTTTEKRIQSFFENISAFECLRGIYKVIINVCKRYRRFEQSELGEMGVYDCPEILAFNEKYGYEKYVVRFTEDFGPITKMTGGMEYVVDKKHVFYKLIVIDDDTDYDEDCLFELASCKQPNTIVSGSGFRFYDALEYTMVGYERRCMPVDIVEGFAGICFDYSDINTRLLRFIQYYRTIDWQPDDDDNVINLFLKACFLGDDFVISYFYKTQSTHLYKVNGLMKHIHQRQFGFMSDALHRNTTFQSNMGSYVHIYKNIDILETFLQKLEVCRRLVRK